MNRDDMVDLWEKHAAYEFTIRDADLAVSTMVDDARVMHLPTMSGGYGKENLRGYYRNIFIPGIPADTIIEMIARSVGDDHIVDEQIMSFTHDQSVPFLLEGLEPTGKWVEVPLIVVVTFRGNLMESERLYWDQAAVFHQVGLINGSDLPLADFKEVRNYLRETAIRLSKNN
jgi:carboxymethylenebutenolidase